MTIHVRRLNAHGLETFLQWINTGPPDSPPKHMLESPEHSEEVEGDFEVDTSMTFATTFALGKHLHTQVFASVVDHVPLYKDTAMWSWISLALIDSLVSKKSKGAKAKGTPLAATHYVQLPGQTPVRHAYKLIARSAWWMARLHGDAAAFVLGSLESPWGEVAEAVIGRQQLASHKGFIALSSTLYVAPDGSLKRGAAGKRTKEAKKNPRAKAGLGSMRRLALTLNQFGRTYNTRGMAPRAMMQLLPREYGRWQEDATR
jgi:hypothetical protein